MGDPVAGARRGRLAVHGTLTPMPTLIIIAAAILAYPAAAHAHCPLCTAGSGALALFAVWLGVDPAAIGIFLGAAAAAMGLWLARYPKRSFVPGQKWFLAALSYALTVVPLLPLFDGMTAINVFIAGDLGAPLNRTYMVNSFLLGTAVGALLLVAAPFASRAVSRARKGAVMPFQGMAITFGLLLASSVLMQVML